MTTHLPMGRTVRFIPGYDRTDDPKTNYGVHGMTIAFYYRGDAGAVQFKMVTDWIPWKPRPADFREDSYEKRGKGCVCNLYPMAADLGYHSPVPRYEDQTCISENCPEIGGVPCYYDGSGLNAEALMVALIYDGEDAVWTRLEVYYHRVFDKREEIVT